jgi:hypothetical protein
MKEVYIGKIIFEGRRSFDTIEEADVFIKELGNRYLRTIECIYPDMKFYIVEYDTPGGYLVKDKEMI